MSAPALTSFVGGQTVITQDVANTWEGSCDDFAQLRAFAPQGPLQVYCRGQSAPNDGGQGVFWWNAGLSNPVDNNWTVVVPSGSSTGAWVRLSYDGLPFAVTHNGSYTVLATDNGKIISTNGGNTFTVPLAASVASASAPFIFYLMNLGTSNTVIAATSPDTIGNGGGFGATANAPPGLLTTVISYGLNDWLVTTQSLSVDGTTIVNNVGVLSIAPAARQGQYQLITSTGTTSWTTPSNITTSTIFKFTLLGGGGGGGGCGNTANYIGGSGQAGYLLTFFASGLSPNTAYAASVGAGGTAGSSGANAGGSGGQTSIILPVLGTIVAAQGAGGAAGSSTALKIADNGADIGAPLFDSWGDVGRSPLGSGGGIAFGGSSAFGRGGYTNLTSSSGGMAGQGYGSGGSGGFSGSGSNEAGGAGTQGFILIEWNGP